MRKRSASLTNSCRPRPIISLRLILRSLFNFATSKLIPCRTRRNHSQAVFQLLKAACALQEMGEVALRVDSAECERVISPPVQSVHDSYCGLVTRPRNLALHPLVVVSVRIAKQINLMSEDFFEL